MAIGGSGLIRGMVFWWEGPYIWGGLL
jgi:hypothetical protein